MDNDTERTLRLTVVFEFPYNNLIPLDPKVFEKRRLAEILSGEAGEALISHKGMWTNMKGNMYVNKHNG